MGFHVGPTILLSRIFSIYMLPPKGTFSVCLALFCEMALQCKLLNMARLDAVEASLQQQVDRTLIRFRSGHLLASTSGEGKW